MHILPSSQLPNSVLNAMLHAELKEGTEKKETIKKSPRRFLMPGAAETEEIRLAADADAAAETWAEV